MDLEAKRIERGAVEHGLDIGDAVAIHHFGKIITAVTNLKTNMKTCARLIADAG